MLLSVVLAKAMDRYGMRLHAKGLYQWLYVVINCSVLWLKSVLSRDREFYKCYNMYRFMY